MADIEFDIPTLQAARANLSAQMARAGYAKLSPHVRYAVEDSYARLTELLRSLT